MKPGRTAMLRLRGPLGALDIICVYWATGLGSRVATNHSMTKLAAAMSPPARVLAVVAGDFNYVCCRMDRICAAHGTFTGEGDREDEDNFQELLGIPFQLAEWKQEHYTHSNAIGRSRIDRMYCNHHVATQLDLEYGCAALNANGAPLFTDRSLFAECRA